jgi:hypothetical protein
MWTRGHSAVRGGIIGGLLLGAMGAIMGASIGEEGNDDYNPAFGALIFGGGGVVGGGLLGALVGLAIPRWDRQYPSGGVKSLAGSSAVRDVEGTP